MKACAEQVKALRDRDRDRAKGHGHGSRNKEFIGRAYHAIPTQEGSNCKFIKNLLVARCSTNNSFASSKGKHLFIKIRQTA